MPPEDLDHMLAAMLELAADGEHDAALALARGRGAQADDEAEDDAEDE